MRKKKTWMMGGLALCVLFLSSCHKDKHEADGNDPEIFSVTAAETGPYNPLSHSGKVTVQCDKKWTPAFQDGSWARIVKNESGEGTSGSITFEISRNTSEETRTDTLVVTSGRQVRKIGIEQRAVTDLISPIRAALQGTQAVMLTVNAPMSWTGEVAGEADWLSFSPRSGGAGTASVKVAASEEYMDVGSRSALLRFHFGEDDFDVEVSQGQTNVILLSQREFSLGSLGGTFSVTVRANVDHEVEISDSWITETGTKALQETEHQFSAAENPLAVSRSATVTFRNGSIRETVTVRQEGADPLLQQSAFGIYSASGDSWVYQAGYDQLSRRTVTGGTVSFRILSPFESRAVEMNGLPERIEAGAQFTVPYRVRQGEATLDSGSWTVTALKAEADKAWLKDAEGNGFIVKNSEK